MLLGSHPKAPMKKAAIFIAAVAALISTSAWAADMAVKAPPPPAAASVPSWTGFYVGGNIGAALEHASSTSDFLDPAAPPGQRSNPQSNSFSNTRFLGGVQAGYNWQFAPKWLIGVEGDWDWTDTANNFCRQTSVLAAACSDNMFGFETISSKTDWLATARGRLGVIWGNWLFYGTGGAAWGRVNSTLTLSCLVAGCGSSTTKLLASSTVGTTRTGWVAGLGAEWMLARNWSVTAEWLRVDLGSINGSLPTTGTTGIQTAVWSRTETFDEFRAGLNYLFRP